MIVNQLTLCKIISYYHQIYVQQRRKISSQPKQKIRCNYPHHSTPICLLNYSTIYRLVGHNRPKNYHLCICTSLYRNIMPVFQNVQDIHVILNKLERYICGRICSYYHICYRRWRQIFVCVYITNI